MVRASSLSAAACKASGSAVHKNAMEADALLHALEDDVDSPPIAALHPLQVRADIIFLPHPFLRPFHRGLVVAGEGFDPMFIFSGSAGEDIFGDGVKPQNIAEEMHNVLFPRQQRQVSLDDDAIKTVIYKSQQAAKQLVEGFHRPVPRDLAFDNKIIDRSADGIKLHGP